MSCRVGRVFETHRGGRLLPGGSRRLDPPYNFASRQNVTGAARNTFSYPKTSPAPPARHIPHDQPLRCAGAAARGAISSASSSSPVGKSVDFLRAGLDLVPYANLAGVVFSPPEGRTHYAKRCPDPVPGPVAGAVGPLRRGRRQAAGTGARGDRAGA